MGRGFHVFVWFAVFVACGDIPVQPGGSTTNGGGTVTIPNVDSTPDSGTAEDAGTPAAIHGTVISFAVPIANAVVTVDGASTSTDASGAFTFPGPADAGTYDVTITVGQNVTIYRGLTTTAPILVAFGATGPLPQTPHHASSFSGHVDGGTTTPYVDAPEISVSGADAITANVEADATGQFSADDIPTWSGTDTEVTGKAHASIVTADGDAYYGTADGVVFAQATATAPTAIALGPIGVAMTLTINASGTSDPSTTTLRAGIFFTSEGGGYALAQSNVPLPIQVQRRLPNVPGATVYAEVASGATTGPWSLARASMPVGVEVTVPIALPASPTATFAANTVTVAATSPVFRVTLTPDADGPTVTMFGASGVFAVTDALPTNAAYHYRAYAYGPPGLDDPTISDLLDVADGSLPPLVSPAQIAGSAAGQLTTAP